MVTGNFLDLLSCHFLICNEMIPGKGEDSGFEAYTREAGIMGVFDGCGGLGAKRCRTISDKTEAYLASRIVAGAVKSWYIDNTDTDYVWSIESLKQVITSKLSFCQKHSEDEEQRLKGTLMRAFPSTIAVVAFNAVEEGINTIHIWAGDSRSYVLDCNGLKQVSLDDIKGGDALNNLTQDGALTNVLSADGRFTLHKNRILLTKPCIVLTATDGCFGYVSSPMEFELMILSSLVDSVNVDDWKNRLNSEIMKRAGDDQTIAVAAFGFGSFSELKRYYIERLNLMVKIVKAFNSSKTEGKQAVWEQYKQNYYKYIRYIRTSKTNK